MTYRSIEAYLEDLSWRLRVGTRGRRRVLAETAAHLADLVGEEEAAGLTPQAAVRRATSRFGTPEALAAEFNRDAALHGLRSAAWTLAGCVGVACAAAGLAQRGWGPAVPWPNEGLYYAVPALLVQVAAVCAGVGFLLAVVAPRLLGRDPSPVAGRALAAAGLALLPVAAVSAGNVAGAVWGEGALSACVTLAVPVAAVLSARAAIRATALGARASTLDVIAECCDALASRWQWTRRLRDMVIGAWSFAAERQPALLSWLELRRHPWRSAVTASVAAGLALKAPDLLRGDVDLPAAALEAAAVFTGYCLFSGLLGLRRRVEPLDPIPVEG